MKYMYSQSAIFSAGLQNSFLSEHCLIFSTFVRGFGETLAFFIGDKKLRDSCQHFDFFLGSYMCMQNNLNHIYRRWE